MERFVVISTMLGVTILFGVVAYALDEHSIELGFLAGFLGMYVGERLGRWAVK